MKDHQSLGASTYEQEDHWVSVADLMAGLMMIFLLIAIIYMVKIESEKQKIKEVAILYEHLKEGLYNDLKDEFDQDFERWGAELYKDLTIRFKEPRILFDTGSHKLKPFFVDILTDFFPRYVEIVASDQYRDSIIDIRIEGHTSSIWNHATAEEDAYFYNMELSQSRTRSTLRFLLGLEAIHHELPWLRKYMTANGLSSSHLIYDDLGLEDVALSQRVEFRIMTNAETRIAKMLEFTQ